MSYVSSVAPRSILVGSSYLDVAQVCVVAFDTKPSAGLIRYDKIA